MHQQAVTYQPIYKRIRIFIVRELPGSAMQPEGFACCFGQIHLAVHQVSCRQMWHERTQLKHDTEKLGVFRDRRRHRFRLWPAHGEIRLALLLRYHYLPITRGQRGKRTTALTLSAPDRFDKRRVRWSSLKDKLHASAPDFSTPVFTTPRFRVRGYVRAVSSDSLTP